MRDDVVHLIANERADLLAMLQQVGPNDWGHPTACAPWTIKDVLAHLVEGELNAGRVYRGEIRESGYLDPEDGIARWRALPGEAVRASLWQHGTATQRVLEALSPDALRQPIRIFGCRDVGQLVRLHLFDLTIHGHDIADAAGAEPVWGPRLPYLVEFVARAAPWTLARRKITPEGSLGVACGELHFTIAARDDTWHVELGVMDAPVNVTIEAGDLVLAVTGRAPLDQVLERAEIDGARADAERIFAGWQVVAQD